MKPLMSLETVEHAINTLLSSTSVLAYSQSVSLGRVAVLLSPGWTNLASLVWNNDVYTVTW